MLTIEPNSSRCLAALILCIHLFALVCLGLTALPWFLLLPLSFGVLWLGAYWLQKLVFFSRLGSLREARLRHDRWQLLYHSGESQAATLSGSSLVTHSLIILNFRLASRKRHSTLILFKDSVSKSLWRTLQYRLRY